VPDEVTVTFEPPGVSVAVPRGATVLDAARRAGVPLSSTCGGVGTCGDCAVRVVAGRVEPPGATEAASLASAPPDVRLACMLHVAGPLTVRPVAPLPHAAAQTAPPAAAPVVSAAVDLGTTTVSAVLLDANGREVAASSTPNPQRTFGADLASRISAAIGGEALQLAGLAARAVDDALCVSGAATGNIRRIVVAGNTAMTHLALGADVAGLAVHPYSGVLSGIVRTTAARLGWQAPAPDAVVVFLPPMAAFVGGDTTAGVLATGLDCAPGVRVLLDVGTNAEVAVARDGALTVASAAAGPAFEAAGLACGAPARAGAVRDVRVEAGELTLDVVGGADADSLCGSGALSLVAALLDAGNLDASGRLVAQGALASRFHHRGDVLAVQVAGEPGGERDVYLTQLDVRELQLAKAAVATALELTLAAAGVSWDRVDEVLVAGAFGAGLDELLLRRLGILPLAGGVRLTPVGDAALAGAALVAADAALEARAEEIAKAAHGVDLAAEPAFQRAFIRHLDLRELA
jgi:uncharacterized 2Fe-2S/4Fe-4S cluster protein (DUF4445 family)